MFIFIIGGSAFNNKYNYSNKKEILEKLESAENKIIELERSNKLYQSVAGLVSDYIFDMNIDPEGNLSLNFLNIQSDKYHADNFYNLLGYTPNELKSFEIFNKIIYPDDLLNMRNFRQKVLLGLQSSYKCRIYTKNGEITWWKGTGKPLLDKNNRVTGAIITANNVTGCKRTEVALKESEEKFREIFNKANDMITLVELEENGYPGRFLEVNDVATERLGYSRKEMLGMKITEIISPEYRSQVAKNAGNLKENKHVTFEIVHITKWGSKIPVEVSTHIFKLRGNNVILAISRDIRERKQSERKLKGLVENLKSSNEELEQFIYCAYHDLQEPLRTVASYTQLIGHRYKDKLDDDANDFINFAVDGALRMQQIIQDLLEYSSVITKGGEFKTVNLEDTLNEAILNLNTIIMDNNAEIAHDELPIIAADKEQIVKLFGNLIENAIKFRKESEPPKIHISVSADKKNREYVFSVSDNGIGLESQYAEQIFVIFQRLHTLDKYPGNGIGLAISRRIVERHGGHIWVKSEPQKGATFYFTIPYDIENLKIDNMQDFKNKSQHKFSSSN
ncbi:PAS domain-containing sensor histidine kinase [Methanobacterium sp.]|uniref:PAS domain-containing sensor histidine kinase n=1 Tax=Methanobacterium sp. TaxID=2164 RepID=UPI003C763FC7